MAARWLAQLHSAFVRNFTLQEILRWMLLFGVLARTIACGLSEGAWPRPCDGCRNRAQISAQDVQSIADGWRADNEGACPTPLRLKIDHAMSAGSSLNDPWGSPFQIVCDGDVTTVISFGPDQEAETADDIVFPPRS